MNKKNIEFQLSIQKNLFKIYQSLLANPNKNFYFYYVKFLYWILPLFANALFKAFHKILQRNAYQ